LDLALQLAYQSNDLHRGVAQQSKRGQRDERGENQKDIDQRLADKEGADDQSDHEDETDDRGDDDLADASPPRMASAELYRGGRDILTGRQIGNPPYPAPLLQFACPSLPQEPHGPRISA